VNCGTTWWLHNRGKIIELPITFSNSANDNLALTLSACLDDAIDFLPEACISAELARQQLQAIPPECADPEPHGILAIYPHCNAAATVNVLVDFIEAELGAMATIDRWSPCRERTRRNTTHATSESRHGDAD
jgi:DNA-binding transcriptional LysR family regulator